VTFSMHVLCCRLGTVAVCALSKDCMVLPRNTFGPEDYLGRRSSHSEHVSELDKFTFRCTINESFAAATNSPRVSNFT